MVELTIVRAAVSPCETARRVQKFGSASSIVHRPSFIVVLYRGGIGTAVVRACEQEDFMKFARTKKHKPVPQQFLRFSNVLGLAEIWS